MLASGQRGVTLTSDEKASCNVLGNRSASSRLNPSDYFWSNSSIFLSVELLSVDFLALDGNLSLFLTFFSGGADEVDGDLTVFCCQRLTH